MNVIAQPRSRFIRHPAEWMAVAAAILLIAGVVVAAWLSYRSHSATEQQFALKHADDMALVLHAHTHDTLLSVDDAVLGIKQAFEQRGMRTNLAEILRNHRDISNNIVLMSVADAQGRLILSTLPIPPNANIATREHFRTHAERDSNQPIISKPVLGKISGKWSFHVSRRINRPDGSFGGIASIAVDLSFWDRLLHAGHLGETRAIALVGDDGAARLVYGKESDVLSRADWKFLGSVTDATVGKTLIVTGSTGAATAGTWLYRHLEGFPLRVAVNLDESVIAARLRSMRNWHAGGAIAIVTLLLLLTAALLVFLSRQRTQAVERAKIADELRFNEERYRSLFDANPLPLFMRDDASMAILAVNQAMVDKYGYSREQFAGMTSPNLISPATRDAYLLFAAARPAKLAQTTHRIHVTQDGTEIEVDVTSRPTQLNGKAVRLVAIHDVSEKLRSELLVRDSEERLRTIADHVGEGLSLFDKNDRLVFFNEGYRRMQGLPGLALGWTFEQVAKARAQVLLSMGEISDVNAFIRERMAQHGAAQMGSIVRRRADGGYHLIRDARTAAGQTIVTLVDITELKRREDALRESEQRFRAMFDHAGIGIAMRSIHDRHRPWVAVNDRFCEMIGYSREELLRKSAADITVAEETGAAVVNNERLRSGKITSYEHDRRIVRRDGSHLWVHQSGAVLADAQGQPESLISTYQDISARKLAEERVLESEGRLRAIIAAEPECVATVSPEGVLIDMNPAGLRMLEASSIDEMRSLPFLSRVMPKYRRAFVRLQRRILAGNSGVLEFEAIGLLGKHCWLEIHGAPLHDASGNITAMLGIARDVTGRRIARETLAVERNLLRTVIDNLPDRIHAKDRDGRYILANSAWMQAWAPGATDITKVRLRDFRPADRVDMIEARDRTVFETGQPSDPREVVYQVDGDQRWFVTSKMPLRDGAGNITGLVGISRDVTDFHRRSLEVGKLNAELEARVVERTAQLTHANEELEAFAASVSHDLRAPLRSLDGFAAGLLEDYGSVLDVAGQHGLGRIRAAVSRMSQLIEDLLSLSRVARMELSVQEVDVGGLAHAIVDELRHESPARKVSVNIHPDLRTTADPSLLRTALVNLLQNAWKFTGNVADACIEVGSVQRHGITAFYVRDNGAGFDMNHAERLFGAFQRLHTDREFPGTGVGLATVRRVMRRHGGEAWAEAAVGQGAIFFFTLSGAVTEVRTEQEVAQSDRLPASPVITPGVVPLNAAVLLVDDDPDVLMLSARALQPDHYEVLTAGTGEEALGILRNRAVGVIVSDFSMPGLDGAQLLAQAAVLHPHTLRIMVSGQEKNRVMQKGISAGEIHHYFGKQHGFEPVRDCIRDWLTMASQSKN